MSNLELSFAIGDYDRNRPLIDGRVGVDGVDPVFMTLSPEEIFFRAFRHQAFDVCEVSFGSYVVSIDKGDPHYIAIPAFLSRAFRHTAILIRTDKGIDKPEDLKGRRIGIAEYQLSANIWARAILEDEYGVMPSDIQWVRGGMERPGRPEKIKLSLPPDVSMEDAPEGRSLNSLLEAGEIDGFIGPSTLSCFDRGHPHVARLFQDSVAVASDYYRRTGIFPIMHLLGIRRHLADKHPWLPNALLKAFGASKNMALEHLSDTSATKVTLPFVEEQLAAARALLGPDFWSYGVPANRVVLDAFLDHHHRQGLSSRKISIDELFHPSTLESFSI
ncbi:MAG: ABC transporter substrate-binding protein [Proteobacteria bacterium]|nr:MAG: ABC transporter substrate-binding protein [Pseudomonadota bacterium]